MFIRFDDAPFLQPRGASIAGVRDRHGRRPSTIWTYARGERLDQVDSSRSASHSIDTPVVIGGDMNGASRATRLSAALTERYDGCVACRG